MKELIQQMEKALDRGDAKEIYELDRQLMEWNWHLKSSPTLTRWHRWHEGYIAEQMAEQKTKPRPKRIGRISLPKDHAYQQQVALDLRSGIDPMTNGLNIR